MILLSGLLGLTADHICGQNTAAAADEEVIFAESFAGELDREWKWLREAPSRWCIRDEGLEIRVMPGYADTVENALIRQFPAMSGWESYAVEVTVWNPTPLRQQYEQAGLTWYVGDRPVFKLVKELVDGEVVVVPGRKPVDGDRVQLRLEINGERFVAKYRTDKEGEFQLAGEGGIARGEDEFISIQCYHGPPDAEHWIRFDDFRILGLRRREQNQVSERDAAPAAFNIASF